MGSALDLKSVLFHSLMKEGGETWPDHLFLQFCVVLSSFSVLRQIQSDRWSNPSKIKHTYDDDADSLSEKTRLFEFLFLL